VLNSIVFFISQYLYRVRENQRMKDVKGLLEQSLLANEVTLRAVQDQNKEQQQQKQEQNKEQQLQKQQIINDGNDGEAIVSHDGTGEVECAKEGQSNTTASEKNTAQNIIQASLVGEDETKHKQESSLSHWTTRVLQYTSSIPSKLLPEKRQVDMPSAILGASVTGMAWLVAMSFSRNGGS